MSSNRKTLVVISGKSSSGKTTVLKRIICEIIHQFNLMEYNLNKKSNIMFNNISFSNINIKQKGIPAEWKVIFDGVNGKTIGINTEGDDGASVTESLKLLDYCDVVVCATKAGLRSDLGSLGTMQNYVNNNYKNIDIIPLFKLVFNEQSTDDKVYLDILKKILIQII